MLFSMLQLSITDFVLATLERNTIAIATEFICTYLRHRNRSQQRHRAMARQLDINIIWNFRLQSNNVVLQVLDHMILKLEGFKNSGAAALRAQVINPACSVCTLDTIPCFDQFLWSAASCWMPSAVVVFGAPPKVLHKRSCKAEPADMAQSHVWRARSRYNSRVRLEIL